MDRSENIETIYTYAIHFGARMLQHDVPVLPNDRDLTDEARADGEALAKRALGDDVRGAIGLLVDTLGMVGAQARVYQAIANAWRDVAAQAGAYGN